MKSVISFPDRGPWGDAGWRGNCSGHVIKSLIEHFNPKMFVDVCEGSGTSRDVCRDLGVQYVGFDLHQGTDFTADYILSRLTRPADMVFSHPPYHSIISYRDVGLFRDRTLIDRDTSGCKSVDEFIEKSRVMLLNQREATREGGVYCSLIGDIRQSGRFRSLQADYIGMMPDELVSVTVKVQHNCWSDHKEYSRLRYPTINHEYLLIWEKSRRTLVQMTVEQLKCLEMQKAMTWRSLVRLSMMSSGGTATVSDIYAGVEKVAGNKLQTNKNWQAKVRQTLQRHFEQVKHGIWTVPQAA